MLGVHSSVKFRLFYIFMDVCNVCCLYLSEALPSCGRVCQGDKLFLHLINPFFNPMGQSNAHNQSCNSGVTSLEETSQPFHTAIKLSMKLSYVYRLTRPSGHMAQKQTRPKRITLIGQAKCQPIIAGITGKKHNAI